MPQTLRLAGSRAVAHVTSRDTPRPPLFRDDDGWPCLRAIPGPVVGHEEVGVAGAKMGCRIARSDPKISQDLTLKSPYLLKSPYARPPCKAVKGWYTEARVLDLVFILAFQVLPMAVASNLFGEVIHARAATTA